MRMSVFYTSSLWRRFSRLLLFSYKFVSIENTSRTLLLHDNAPQLTTNRLQNGFLFSFAYLLQGNKLLLELQSKRKE